MRRPSKISGRSVAAALATAAVVGAASGALVAQGQSGSTMPAAPPSDASAAGLTVVNRTVAANPTRFRGFNAFQTYTYKAPSGKAVLQGFATTSGGKHRVGRDHEHEGDAAAVHRRAASSPASRARRARSMCGCSSSRGTLLRPDRPARGAPLRAARARSGCPGPRPALHPHVAPQRARELAADREPEPAAAPAVRGLQRLEGVEDPLQVAVEDARTGVGDGGGEAAAGGAPGPPAARCRRGRPVQRVVEQVGDDLLRRASRRSPPTALGSMRRS